MADIYAMLLHALADGRDTCQVTASASTDLRAACGYNGAHLKGVELKAGQIIAKVYGIVPTFGYTMDDDPLNHLGELAVVKPETQVKLVVPEARDLTTKPQLCYSIRSLAYDPKGGDKYSDWVITYAVRVAEGWVDVEQRLDDYGYDKIIRRLLWFRQQLDHPKKDGLRAQITDEGRYNDKLYDAFRYYFYGDAVADFKKANPEGGIVPASELLARPGRPQLYDGLPDSEMLREYERSYSMPQELASIDVLSATVDDVQVVKDQDRAIELLTDHDRCCNDVGGAFVLAKVTLKGRPMPKATLAARMGGSYKIKEN